MTSHQVGSPRSLVAGVLLGVATAALALLPVLPVAAQETLPWQRSAQNDRYQEDVYRERLPDAAPGNRDYDDPNYQDAPPASSSRGYGDGSAYNRGPEAGRAPYEPQDRQYGNVDRGRPYYNGGERYERYDPPPQSTVPYREDRRPGTYSQGEIVRAGHGFFGSISKGLASAIEYVFDKQGRPNGYILGEDGGGAFIAGLRYGEGKLYTRDAGVHRVYWQGPTLGYDFGAEGSKVMVLVYNLRHPGEIYQRFGGVQGSAYLVGGVSVQLQSRDDVVLAPIRAGVGVRLGANVGYLKYTRAPTWNPF